MAVSSSSAGRRDHPSARCLPGAVRSGGAACSTCSRPLPSDPAHAASALFPVGSPPVRAYRTVVVGTDGSESSLRAVGRAAALAGACGATLVIACAYLPMEADQREVAAAQDALRDDAYQVVGSHPAEDTVRTAAERAAAA